MLKACAISFFKASGTDFIIGNRPSEKKHYQELLDNSDLDEVEKRKISQDQKITFLEYLKLTEQCSPDIKKLKDANVQNLPEEDQNCQYPSKAYFC